MASSIQLGVDYNFDLYIYKFNYTIESQNININFYEGRYKQIDEFTNINYIQTLIDINNLKGYVYNIINLIECILLMV